MDNIKTGGMGLLAVLAIVFGVLYFKAPTAISVPEFPLGGSGSGQSVSFRQFFMGGMTQGGSAATTSTAATYTLVAKDFVNQPTVIFWTPNVNTTLSLSATSTFAYVPNVGDTAVIYIRNASTTAAASITYAAVDGGIDLQKNEDTSDLATVGLDWTKLTLIRTAVHKTTVLFEDLTEAD